MNYRAQDLTVEVMRITDGNGVNVVFENIADPDLFPKAFATLAFGGRLVTAGAHGGGKVTLDVKHLYLNGITIFGDPRDSPDSFEVALRAAAEGKLRVLIDQILPLSQAVLAHELAEARDGLGKVLLDVTRVR